MKILQIIYESFGNPYGFGGAGVRAYEIYRRLAGSHEIDLLCMKYPGARDGEIGGLNHIFRGTESKSLTASVLAYTIQASRYVKRHGSSYDIVVENFLPSTPFFSKLLTRTPVVLQVQGIMERHSFRKFSPLYSVPMYLCERFYPSLYDKFIFVSEVTRKQVVDTLRKTPQLCKVIPNGVPREYLETDAHEGEYLLFFSRIDIYTKGLDILLSAFALLAPEFPDIRLVLAGHEFDSFSKLSGMLPPHLRGRVEYAGFLTGDEKIRLLSGARVVVLPSRHESSPVSVLEAAACAKPLVVSDIAELKFVEEHGFGVCSRVGSPESLKECLASLLKDSGRRKTLGSNGRRYARSFVWDSIAKDFENALQLMTHEK